MNRSPSFYRYEISSCNICVWDRLILVMGMPVFFVPRHLYFQALAPGLIALWIERVQWYQHWTAIWMVLQPKTYTLPIWCGNASDDLITVSKLSSYKHFRKYDVLNHRQLDCLLSILFRRIQKHRCFALVASVSGIHRLFGGIDSKQLLRIRKTYPFHGVIVMIWPLSPLPLFPVMPFWCWLRKVPDRPHRK